MARTNLLQRKKVAEVVAKKPDKGMKFVSNDKYSGQVPKSTEFGDEFDTWASEFGIDCHFGNHVEVKRAVVGSRLTTGDNVRIENSTIGNDVAIESNTVIGEYCRIGDNVKIGQDVTLHNSVYIQPGVVIPDHWFIPVSCIVNPGPDGNPVVIIQPPRFSCNVQPVARYR